MKKEILNANRLVLEYQTGEGEIRSLDSASLRIFEGDVVGLVGESGSGKTTLGMSAGRLLSANAVRVSGEMTVDGVDVFGCTRLQLRRLRRESLGYVFQNPLASLDPTMRIVKQMRLATSDLTIRLTASDFERELALVGLQEPARVLSAFPHELSGGMAQRVAIATSLLRRPRLLVADEPTAALDPSVREQVLRLLVERCRQQGCALLLLTHDLSAVGKYTDQVAVMYGGRVIEHGPTSTVVDTPFHPYTRALLSAVPAGEQKGDRLASIPGVPPILRGPSPGCAFAPRCEFRLNECDHVRPELTRPDGDTLVACHLYPMIATDRREDKSDLNARCSPEATPPRPKEVSSGATRGAR